MRGLTRRRLLRLGCAALACAPLARAGLAFAVSDGAERERLLAQFSGVAREAAAMAAATLGPAAARGAADDARAAFARMLGDMPDIGGPSNRNYAYLVQAGWLAAIHAALAPRGMTPLRSGRILYDMAASEMAATPPSVLTARGEAFFSAQGRAELEAWAIWSQRRLEPGDWVGRAVSGGDDFDLGYDMLECGALKFFRSQGMEALAPYFCFNDFPRSKAEGTGLERQGTLAQGAKLCDFRYKRGRQVTRDWDTEAARVAAG